MPCYVNPDVAQAEKDVCEKRWLLFQIVQYVDTQRLPASIQAKLKAEREAYIAHRREDRDFLMDFLDRKMQQHPEDSLCLESIKQEVRALTDDQLISTYWGTWEDSQLASGEYRGEVLSASAHPPSHVSRSPVIPGI